jgi:hypothetical protein
MAYNVSSSSGPSSSVPIPVPLTPAAAPVSLSEKQAETISKLQRRILNLEENVKLLKAEGVDLQDKVKVLAEENVAFRDAVWLQDVYITSQNQTIKHQALVRLFLENKLLECMLRLSQESAR